MPVADRTPSIDGRKRRWQQHTADRRSHIISAAMTVLARDIAPGERMTAQQISAEASVHRTGLYRYFDDRTDLDTSIQRVICADLRSTLLSSAAVTGTPREYVYRMVNTYVSWVTSHSQWARFVEQDLAADSRSPLDETIDEIADQLEQVVAAFLALVGADLSADDHTLIGPWVSGLISGCMGAIRSWERQDESRRAGLEQLATFQADTIWIQVTGLAASRGFRIPKVALEKLAASRDSQIT